MFPSLKRRFQEEEHDQRQELENLSNDGGGGGGGGLGRWRERGGKNGDDNELRVEHKVCLRCLLQVDSTAVSLSGVTHSMARYRSMFSVADHVPINRNAVCCLCGHRPSVRRTTTWFSRALPLRLLQRFTNQTPSRRWIRMRIRLRRLRLISSCRHLHLILMRPSRPTLRIKSSTMCSTQRTMTCPTPSPFPSPCLLIHHPLLCCRHR